ncbi:YceI family protein [Streptomyces prunicolor]|uniref:YceI family protein n=1 Tax=Streptomyces prunicolor TaxID=67348 RepID=UPI00340CA762
MTSSSASHIPTALREVLGNGSLAGHWTLDPAQSTVSLRSKHAWGLAAVKGAFRSFEGDGTVSPTGEVTGRLVIAAGSVDTNSKARDAHLRDQFFLSEKYPSIAFALDKFVQRDELVTVHGVLTVQETSLPISFPAKAALTGDSEAVLEATVQVDRSDYGITVNKIGMVSMKATISVRLVFTKD